MTEHRSKVEAIEAKLATIEAAKGVSLVAIKEDAPDNYR